MIWWFSNLLPVFLRVSKQIVSLTAATKETLPLLPAFTINEREQQKHQVFINTRRT